MSEDKKYTLEENFDRLESKIRLLERDEVSLEEAFLAYSEGMSILRECNNEIDRVEKQVMKLTSDGCLETFEGLKDED